MSLHILIIDGDLSFIVRLRKALNARKHHARTERRPLIRMHDIVQENYDIAIVDRNMIEFFEVISTLQEHLPNLPILVSGKSPSDAEVVAQVEAQGYINKPYVARDLLVMIEFTFAQLSITAHIDDEWEESQPDGADVIPRPERYLPEEYEKKTTLSDVFTALIGDDDGATVIFDPIDLEELASQPMPAAPSTLPESTTQIERSEPVVIEEPPLKHGDSMASQALWLAHDDVEAASALFEAAQDITPPKIKALPSWSVAPTAEDEAHVEDLIGDLPMMILPRYDSTTVDESPQAAYTQPTTLPEIDLFPEDHTPLPSPDSEDMLDLIANATSAEDTKLQEALRNYAGVKIEAEPPENEALVEATVEQVTQSMGIVFDDADEVDEYADIATEDNVIARAALRLTQLSLESTALGAILMQGEHIVTKQGDLDNDVWNDIVDEIVNAWQQGSSSNTRLLYRKFDKLGQLLLFSTHTINELTLTMIFSSSTSLKVIRRQAKRIAEALLEVPIEAEPEFNAATATPIVEPIIEEEPPATPQVEEDVPPAAQTSPSRPTALRPPEDRDERLQTQAPEAKPARAEGTYTGYACLWLIQTPVFADNHELADAMQKWLQRSAENEDWDLIDADIRQGWVNIHIEIPVKTSPAEAIETLMNSTAESLLDALGESAPEQPWSSSYSVMTPGRLLHDDEIENFIRFYTEA